MSDPKTTQVGGDHYVKLTIQPWEVMREWMTPEEYRGYHKGVVFAYLAREIDKGGNEDIKKALHHLSELVDFLNDQDEKDKKSSPVMPTDWVEDPLHDEG